MQRLRAALLGCLLTGGVIFGAPPAPPDRRLLRPVVYASDAGRLGLSAEELARWVRPAPIGATLASLRPASGACHVDDRLLPTDSATGPVARMRRRCNAGRLRRYRTL